MNKIRIPFLILILLIWPAAVFAQSSNPQPSNPEVRLSAEPLFEGNFKYGEWLPVVVELENQGPDIEAELRSPVLSTGGTVIYSSPVELPAGSKKRLTLYVLPNNFSRQLDIELVSGSTLLARQRIQIQPNPTINLLTGIIAADRGALAWIQSLELQGINRPKTLIDIPLAQLPERSEGLRSFDVIVLNDVDTSGLSTQQISALETWVQAGGILVVGGGPNAQLTVAGLSDVIFPGEVIETIETNELGRLEDFVGAEKTIHVPGPFILARLSATLGRTLAGEASLPFVHIWNVGTGLVYFSALDLAGSPFDSWSESHLFWDKLLSAQLAFPSWLPVDIGARQQFASNMPYALQNLPLLDLPSVRGMAVMLLCYILSVGPINYFILKRARRLQFAWVSIPAITLLFSALTLGFGIALHGTDIFVNKITFLQVESSGDAKYTAFVGVYSPARTSYQVSLSGGGLISPLSPYYEPWMSSIDPGTAFTSGNTLTMVQGEPALVKGLSVDQWSMQSFMSEGKVEDFGKIESELLLSNETLTGKITNQTGFELIDSYLILGQKYVHTGPILPSGSSDIDLDLSSLGSPLMNNSLSYTIFEKEINQNAMSSDRRIWESRRAVIESIFERTPPYFKFGQTNAAQNSLANIPVFVAWIDDATPDVQIVGSESSQQAASVIVTALKYEFPNQGALSIPVGMIPGQLTKTPPDGSYCGMSGTLGVYLPNGEAYFDFALPEYGGRYSPTTLRFGIWSDNQAVFVVPKVDFYDYKEQDWTPLQGIQQGILRLPDAQDFVAPDGKIQVRLTIIGGQGCYFLALGAESPAP